MNPAHTIQARRLREVAIIAEARDAQERAARTAELAARWQARRRFGYAVAALAGGLAVALSRVIFTFTG